MTKAPDSIEVGLTTYGLGKPRRPVTVRVGDTVWTWTGRRAVITHISPAGQVAFSLRRGKNGPIPDWYGYGTAVTTDPNECIEQQQARIADAQREVERKQRDLATEQEKLDVLSARIDAQLNEAS